MPPSIPRARRAHRLVPLLVAVALAHLALACVGDGSAVASGEEPWVTTVDSTSDTVVIRIAGEIPPALVRTLVPELEVGAEDGSEAESFGSIGTVLGTPSGGLLVHDVQAVALRSFDATGAFMRTVGASGGGPGEFGQVNGVTRLRDGRLVVWDASGNRLNVYDAEGTFLTTWRLPFQGFFSRNVLWSDTAGRTLVFAIFGSSADPTIRPPRGVIRIDSDGRVVDSVPYPVWGAPAPRLEARSPDGRSMSAFSMPFWPQSLARTSPLGGMVSGPGSPYVLYLTGADRTKPVRIERESSPVPVSAIERTENVAVTTFGLRQQDPAWSWTVAEVPAHKPAYRQLLIGEDGLIWVQVSVPGEPIPAAELPPRPAAEAARPRLSTREASVYDVFTPEGRLLGRVALPPRTRVHTMAGPHVWGVRRDSLDVEYAVRFRIEPAFRR